MNKKQKELQRKKEDIAFNHAMIWVGVAIVFELLLLLVNRYYFHFTTSQESINAAYATENALRIARIAGPVVMVAGIVLAVMGLVKPPEARGKKVGIGLILVVLGALAALCAHITLVFQQVGLQMLLLLVPAFAGLALVYYLYQREFFCCALFSGLGLVELWMLGHRNDHTFGTIYGFLALMVVVIIACCVVVKATEKNEYRLAFGGAEVALLPKESSPMMMLITAAISIALPVAALAVSAIAYYAIYVLLGWLFALFVYYTVKMM